MSNGRGNTRDVRCEVAIVFKAAHELIASAFDAPLFSD